jgi:hypothetical protein
MSYETFVFLFITWNLEILFNKHVENYLDRRNYQTSSIFLNSYTLTYTYYYAIRNCIRVSLIFVFASYIKGCFGKGKEKSWLVEKSAATSLFRPNKHLTHHMTPFQTVVQLVEFFLLNSCMQGYLLQTIGISCILRAVSRRCLCIFFAWDWLLSVLLLQLAWRLVIARSILPIYRCLENCLNFLVNTHER